MAAKGESMIGQMKESLYAHVAARPQEGSGRKSERPLWRVPIRDGSAAEEIARLQAECQQLRWERDRLATQTAGAESLWQQLAILAAECDELRFALARHDAAEQQDMRNAAGAA
jgi:hypothetical protein